MESSDSEHDIIFDVSKSTVVGNLLGRALTTSYLASRNPERKEEIFRKGRVNPKSQTVSFVRSREDISNLIHSDGTNVFDSLARLSSRIKPFNTDTSINNIRRAIQYEYNLTDEQMCNLNMKRLIDDLQEFSNSDEVMQVMDYTNSYKNAIEKLWQNNHINIMKHIKQIVGTTYEMKSKGKMAAYVMYPSFSTNKASQVGKGESCLFFGKEIHTDICKILGELSYQNIKTSYIPYKSTMTSTKKKYHRAFLKFLAAKEVYSYLSSNSALCMFTDKEDPEIMAKVYPFWLGYKYRNIDKVGKVPVDCIAEEIAKDKEFVENLPSKSKKRAKYAKYDFDSLDPKKIANLFIGKRGITPYEFNDFDFNNRKLVCKCEQREKEEEK